jgi:drug/metabolite transporter (DMT)-like permease
MKALSRINLSLYSLFAMLGGMLLPFLQGLIFYDEVLTLGKIVCVVLISAALFFSVSGTIGSHGLIFYIGVFVLNGMSGVITKLFESAPYLKTSAAGYSVLSTAMTVLISGIILLLIKKQGVHIVKKAIAFAFCGGILGRVANFLLLLALAVLPASTQYPMVTGGTMIVSTLICFLGDKKPSRKELVSVALAFAAMLSLFLIPV